MPFKSASKADEWTNRYCDWPIYIKNEPASRCEP